MRNRGWRRAQRKRLIQRALKIVKPWQLKDSKRWVVRNVDNLKACSCMGCRNARKEYGETLQELRCVMID